MTERPLPPPDKIDEIVRKEGHVVDVPSIVVSKPEERTDAIDLKLLADPFPPEDIEWRIGRSGNGAKGIFAMALAYITARAIQSRLDAVCGPENWMTAPPQMIEVNGKTAFSVGISIRLGDGWITKWDVADPTNIEPAKGGFSGAMKRAGAQWGIGRYLYHLDETFVDVSENRPTVDSKKWRWAKLSKQHGEATYYWKVPDLPAWAVPKEKEHEISEDELTALKRAWKDKFAADIKVPADLRNGFAQFVTGIIGEFPIADWTCWTKDALNRCQQRIIETTDPKGPDSDVPFEDTQPTE